MFVLIPGSLIELMGVSMGNETTIATKQNFSDLNKKLFVMPGHYAVFKIGMATGSEEGEFHASVFVSTEFEEMHIPFRLRVAKGSLSLSSQDLSFEPAYPVNLRSLKRRGCPRKIFLSEIGTLLTKEHFFWDIW